MKKTLLAAALLAASLPTTSKAVDPCGTILCLSAGIGGSIGACFPYLSAYFSIDYSNPIKTIKERLDFLRGCDFISASSVGDISIPGASTADLSSLINAIVSGAGFCDPVKLAAKMNASIFTRFGDFGDPKPPVPTELPAACIAYAEHPITYGIQLPVKKELCRTKFVDGRPWPIVTCSPYWVAPPALTEAEIMSAARADAEEYVKSLRLER